jgi:adenylate kinase
MSYNLPPKVIIIIGPPGSGKGTQATLLSEKLDLVYLETSRIGEERIKKAKRGEYIFFEGQKFYFEKEKKLWEEGKLWDPPFITFLVMEEIKNIYAMKKGIIFAGSPRTLYEAERILPLLKKLYGKESIKVIVLEISEKQSIYRNSRRRICQLMRHPILYNKQTKNLKICPLDGSKLIKRGKLDWPETIKIRLKEYKERTLPVIDYFKKEKIEVKKIDGSLSPDKVFHSILKALKLKND